MSDQVEHEIDDAIARRVCGEFLEMPGLRVTARQAMRLWGLDEQTCLNVMEMLVSVNFLRRSDGSYYSRATDGPAAPTLRMRRESDALAM